MGIEKQRKLSSELEEAFRTLRSNVLLRLKNDNKCLLVTSARRGGGTSMISANLSRLLAGSGKSVLLIDANLRRPSLHRLFQARNETGLSVLLKSGGDPGNFIHPVAEKLSLLPSGPLPQDPQQLLTGDGRLDQVLRTARRTFDVIVLDSPPVLESPDAPLLAMRADGVIVVMCAGQTTAADAVLLRRRLEQAGATLWGSVLNNSTLASLSPSGDRLSPDGSHAESRQEEAVAKTRPAPLRSSVLGGEGIP